MHKLALLSLLISFWHFKIYAQCHIKTYKEIVRASQFDFSKSQLAIISTDCHGKIVNSFREMIVSGKGVLTSNLLKGSGHKKVVLIPQNVRLQTLDDLIKSKILPQKKWFFKESKILGDAQDVFFLNDGELLNVDQCPTCHKTGSKTIKIDITNDFGKNVRTVWIKGRLLIETEALVFKKNVEPYMGPLKKDLFETKVLLSDRPEQLFTDRDKLNFYRPSRPKRMGELLKTSDLTPLHLVVPGRPVKIILSSGDIKLLSKAMPMQRGKLGENIKLKNIRTKKIITGEVVDFNKVVVKL